MKPGTRILLAVLTLLMGVIVLYWGVFYRGGNGEAVLVNDPTVAAPEDDGAAASEPSSARTGDLVPVGTPPPRRAETDPAASSSTPAAVLGRDEPRLDPSPDPAGETPTAADPEATRPSPAPPGPGDGAAPSERPGEAIDGSPTTDRAGLPGGMPRQQPGPDRTPQTPPQRPAADEASAARSPDERAPAAHTPYVVKDGDTLSSIAQRWFGEAARWELIQQANPAIDPRNLRIGQVLLLPARNETHDDEQRSAGGSGTYTVRSGDTLSSIARARLGAERHWRLIYEANRRLIGSNPDAIAVGMELIIPERPPADGS
ncbi:MAG: LysM peptidoglycan-binding domain-containing protein [Planctomycetota bacterium]|nr:LysM peptidoglycan-binding domain-containing protein [Planctomycetota bacterium]